MVYSLNNYIYTDRIHSLFQNENYACKYRTLNTILSGRIQWMNCLFLNKFWFKTLMKLFNKDYVERKYNRTSLQNVQLCWIDNFEAIKGLNGNASLIHWRRIHILFDCLSNQMRLKIRSLDVHQRTFGVTEPTKEVLQMRKIPTEAWELVCMPSLTQCHRLKHNHSTYFNITDSPFLKLLVI